MVHSNVMIGYPVGIVRPRNDGVVECASSDPAAFPEFET